MYTGFLGLLALLAGSKASSKALSSMCCTRYVYGGSRFAFVIGRYGFAFKGHMPLLLRGMPLLLRAFKGF